MDVFVTSSNNSFFFKNTGSATFSVIPGPVIDVFEAVLSDINLNSKVDLIYIPENGLNSREILKIQLSLGNFSIAPAISYSINGLFSSLKELALGDFNNDGKIDIAALSELEVSILAGTAQGLFAPTIN